MTRKNPSMHQRSKSYAQPGSANPSSSPALNLSWFPSPLRVSLKFPVSSFLSQTPRRFGAIRGSKRVDFTSVRGDSGEVGGPLRYRFGGGFLTGKNLPLKHKHRPHQHLKFLPTISSLPNTFILMERQRVKDPAKAAATPLRQPQISFHHSAVCTPKSALNGLVVCVSLLCRSCAVSASLHGRLCVGHVLVVCRFSTATQHPRKPTTQAS